MTRRTGPTPRQVADVVHRDQGCCRRCGAPGEQIHHRKPRGRGGTRDPKINNLSNLVFLCQRCHEHIERNRAEAYDTGWLVHRWDDPASCPLTGPTGLMFELDDAGNVGYATFRSAS